MKTISFDGVIVGGGGAGMRAALQLAQSGHKTAVISKGVSNALAHRVSAGRALPVRHRQFDDPNDDWRWHMYDTVQGIGLHRRPRCHRVHVFSVGPEAIYELEHMGLPFSSHRRAGAFISDRLGGSRKEYGKPVAKRPLGPVQPRRTARGMRYCTRCIRPTLRTRRCFSMSGIATDLVKNQDGSVVAGVIAICIETGESGLREV